MVQKEYPATHYVYCGTEKVNRQFLSKKCVVRVAMASFWGLVWAVAQFLRITLKDFFFQLQMLAECLLECHRSSVADGQPLSLCVFISGRNRLENDGATALSAAFKVSVESFQQSCNRH